MKTTVAQDPNELAYAVKAATNELHAILMESLNTIQARFNKEEPTLAQHLSRLELCR